MLESDEPDSLTVLSEQAQALQDELKKLREQFTVDTDSLKKISEKFQEELEEGKMLFVRLLGRPSEHAEPWNTQYRILVHHAHLCVCHTLLSTEISPCFY